MKKILKILKILLLIFLLFEYVPIKLAVDEKEAVKNYKDKYADIYKDVYVCTIEDASMAGYYGATKENNPQLAENLYFNFTGNDPFCVLNKNLRDQCIDGELFFSNNKYVICGNIKDKIGTADTYDIYKWDIVYPVHRNSYLDILKPKYGLNIFDFDWITIAKCFISKNGMFFKLAVVSIAVIFIILNFIKLIIKQK